MHWQKETVLFYLISFTRTKLNPIGIIQQNLITFQCNVGCVSRANLYGMQRKILDRWIVNRWIVHRELAQPFFHRTPPTAATSVSTENIPANV